MSDVTIDWGRSWESANEEANKLRAERDALAAENERLRAVVKLGAKLRHLAAHKDEPYNSPHNAALYSAGDMIPISEGAFWEFVLSAYAMFPDEAKETTT